MPSTLHHLTEDEKIIQENGKFAKTILFYLIFIRFFGIVAKFSQEIVQPKVRQMDEDGQLDPSILSGLFNASVRIF
jgi:hypothetical protein